MIILLDAMGGDNAPDATIKGAVKAINDIKAEVVLIGNKDIINKKIKEFYDKDDIKEISPRLSIHHTTETIEMVDIPTHAIKHKKDSSMVVGFNMLKEGKGDVFISAGNSGALLTGATLLVGRIKGIDRPSIATPIPTGKGSVTLLLDSGANVDCKPKHLCQSALMGSIYAKCMLGLENPAVGLLNIGEEATKGNEQAQATYPMLKSMKTINFKGNAEGRDVPTGQFDVVVCDGFVGNVVLKFAEGLAKTLVSLAKEAINKGGILAKLGALMLMPALKKLGKDIDVSEYGGAPLLGVNGCCIISHGSSNAKAICSAIRQASEFVQKDVITQIRDNIDKEEIWSHDTEVK